MFILYHFFPTKFQILLHQAIYGPGSSHLYTYPYGIHDYNDRITPHLSSNITSTQLIIKLFKLVLHIDW